ncbi:MAG: class I SAM-dependent methyltransferase [Promethearchaeota archaeon]
MLIWIVLISILLPITVLLLGYPRINLPRQTVDESMEDMEVVQAFDRISQWPGFKFIRRAIVRELRRFDPKGVLVDVGCGPGYLIMSICKEIPHLKIIGVDISEEMIQKASANLLSLRLGDQVEFRKGDIKRMPFRSGTVDFVVSTFSLHHWSDPKQSLNEIRRILKPKGQFLLFDFRRDSRRLFYWLLTFASKTGPERFREDDEPMASFLSSYTSSEMESVLSKTQFTRWGIRPRLGWMYVWGYKT